mgnify:CR=1 FL=1
MFYNKRLVCSIFLVIVKFSWVVPLYDLTRIKSISQSYLIWLTKIKDYNNKYIKIDYQEEYLKNIYTNSNTLVSQIESLDLEHKLYGRTALIMLIDYISDYNKNIIKIYFSAVL